jgi:hypothetical protein
MARAQAHLDISGVVVYHPGGGFRRSPAIGPDDGPAGPDMDLFDRIDAVRERFEALEPSIGAFLPEERRFERLRGDAAALCERWPDVRARPPLFGLLRFEP